MKIPSFAIGAALAAASLVASLAAGEGLLRLAGFSYPAWHAPDELAGVRLRPGVHGAYRDEGASIVRINADGWRDRERTRAKPAGVSRIAVLGDSFMEGLQVDLEKTFTSRLEAALNSCRPEAGPVEVLNFGVSSYGTAQQLLTLRERVWPYDPDLVVLAFLPSNDVRNNSRTLEGWTARPFFRLEDERLVLDASFRDAAGFREKLADAPADAWLDRWRLHQLWRRVRDGKYSGWNDAPAASALASGKGASLAEAGIAERVFVPPPDAAWEDAWRVTEALVSAMHADAKSQGVRFMLMTIPSPAAVYPDPALRQRYARALGAADLSYPDRRMGRLGEARGFEVVTLAGEMQQRADEARTFLHGFRNTRLGFGHWNEDGHAAAAEIVAERLCSGEPLS